MIPLIIEVLDTNVKEEKLHPKLDDLQYRNFVDGSYTFDDLLRELRKIQKSDDVPTGVLQAQAKLSGPVSLDEIIKLTDYLVRSNSESADDVLAGLVQNHSHDVSMYCGLALAERTKGLDQRAVDGLKKALRNPHIIDRAVGFFVTRNDEEAIEALWEAFQEKKDYKLTFIRALTKIKNPFVVPFLLKLLALDQEVILVVRALRQFTDTRIPPEIILFYNRNPNINTDSQMELIKTLGAAGDMTTEDTLNFVFNLISTSAAQNQVHILRACLETLEPICNERILKVMEEQFKAYPLSRYTQYAEPIIKNIRTRLEK